MRHFMLSIVALTLLLAPARADEAAIRSVISQQIEAFQADDFPTAFSYASPNIQRIFGNSRNFGAMVRNGYPMVWRPAEVEFLEVDIIDGLPWQGVMIRDQAGVRHVLDYQMIEGETGWKINAVRLRRSGEATA